MTTDDAPEFTQRLAVLLAVFSRQDSDGLISESYFRALSDIPLPEITAALDHALRHSIHMPRPAEIRNTVASARRRRADRISTRKALGLTPNDLPAGITPEPKRFPEPKQPRNDRKSFRKHRKQHG